MHFVDLNADEQVFNLKFAGYIKRMEDAMLRLLKVERECKLNDIQLTKPRNLKDFMSTIDDLAQANQTHPSLLFEQIEKDSIEHEKFINQQLDSVQKINEQINLMTEYKTVINVSAEFIFKKIQGQDVEGGLASQSSELSSSLMASLDGAVSVGHIAGTIESIDVDRFRRMIFRSSRGNALTVFREMKKPIIRYGGEEVYKTVFVIIFEEGEYLRNKMTRLVDSFYCNKFDIPKSGLRQKLTEIQSTITKSKKIS